MAEIRANSGKEQQTQALTKILGEVARGDSRRAVAIASSENQPQLSPMKSMVFNFWNSATMKHHMAKQRWNQEPLFSLIAAELRPSSRACDGQFHAA